MTARGCGGEAQIRCWCGGPILRGACLASKFHDPHATGERERHSRLYIAGPMSGYPECNYPAFNEAARYLRDVGYEVVNPAEFGEGKHYVDFIREDLRLMLDCHGIAVLDGWWESPGARNEVATGGLLKMPVRTPEIWLARASLELKETRSAHV